MVAKVVSKEQADSYVYFLKLVVPSGFTFLPGQFLVLDLGADPTGRPIKRAYSIASDSGSLPEIELLIKTQNESRSRPFLEKLKPGDFVLCSGPFGKFAFKNSGKRQIFIAAGTGIAPIRSIVSAWARTGTTPAVLIYGARESKMLFYDDEFKNLCRFRTDFAYIPLPRDKAERVTEYIKNLSLNSKKDTAYVCGPPEMVSSVLERLADIGFSKDSVCKEVF